MADPDAFRSNHAAAPRVALQGFVVAKNLVVFVQRDFLRPGLEAEAEIGFLA